MDHLLQKFQVSFEYKVYFCRQLFDLNNPLFNEFLLSKAEGGKIMFVIDEGILNAGNQLDSTIRTYFDHFTSITLVPEIVVLPGGELVKNDPKCLNLVLDAVNRHAIDRHSFIAAVGGGSVLDLVGYASAIAHRGIRHIRIPSTVLSQNDSGVGVKNGVNSFGKKNFLGTFAPPVAVFNDESLLETLSDRDWRSGISEAIKVALIKDSDFFEWLEQNALLLNNRSLAVMSALIKRCAALHLEHIAGSDPFETGSSRPLDFGHWSAHKLEQMSKFEILHGEAVAMGIALDTVYSRLDNRIGMTDANRVINLLLKLGFDVYHPLMHDEHGENVMLRGLDEFREHLGGKLTIMLLDGIGKGTEVHMLDKELIHRACLFLKTAQEDYINGAGL